MFLYFIFGKREFLLLCNQSGIVGQWINSSRKKRRVARLSWKKEMNWRPDSSLLYTTTTQMEDAILWKWNRAVKWWCFDGRRGKKRFWKKDSPRNVSASHAQLSCVTLERLESKFKIGLVPSVSVSVDSIFTMSGFTVSWQVSGEWWVSDTGFFHCLVTQKEFSHLERTTPEKAERFQK